MVRFKKDKRGYKRFADSGKYVHRHVAERKLGRKIPKGWDVHHKNGIKTDNRRCNLEAMPKGAHYKLHKDRKKKTGRWI